MALHLEMPDHYNKFFNPNMCHVCKLKDDGNQLTCEKCYMISYCTLEHKLKDESNHNEICIFLQSLLKRQPQFWTTVQLNLEGWVQSRKEFVQLIKLQLSRPLKSYEMQMIVFAKSCIICHQQVNIQPCEKCWCVNYCPEHVEDFNKEHSPNCRELDICLKIIDYSLRGDAIPTIKFSTFPDKNRPYSDIYSFIEQYVRRGYYIGEHYKWLYANYFYSDYASAPLTLYNTMLNVESLRSISKRFCVIHIVAATPIDREYIAAWELFLHLSINVRELIIVMIGLELQTECKSFELCSKCTIIYKRILTLQSCHMMYQDYVSSNLYHKPDLIIGFQVDLNEWEMVSESIATLQDQNCPLLLTAKSRHTSEQNISKMQEILGLSLDIVYHDENIFSSAKPYRDFENNGVAYRNKFITVYRNLQTISSFYTPLIYTIIQ